MTPQELKNSILQLAVQGKLVEQRPEEGTGEELLRKIQAEKQKLAKAGKIKKEKPQPEITDDEKPFDIPDSWKWVRLGQLLRVIGGISYDKKDVGNTGYRILRGGNIQQMKVSFEEDDVFLPEQYRDEDKLIRKGDILVVASTGSKAVIGKAGYVDKDIPDTMIGAFLRICRSHLLATVDYLRCIFASDFYRKHIRELSQGTNINNVKESYITEFAVPLPPLAEQKRIVAKIEELLPLIDRYGQAWERLEEFNKRFPGDMQKAILQTAIQGKLVEQRPEEGTGEELYRKIQAEKRKLVKAGKIKKEKPLPEITEDEIPFDIPDSWKWVRVSDCVSGKAGLAYNKGNLDVHSDKMIRVLRGGNISEMGYTTKPDDVMISAEFVDKGLLLRRNTIITPAVTSLEHVGKMGRIKEDHDDMVAGGFVLMLSPHINDDIFAQYLLTAFSSKYFRDCCRSIVNKSGQAFYNLSRGKMLALTIPLPPLEEQKRIVAKIEELLPLCERLK